MSDENEDYIYTSPIKLFENIMKKAAAQRADRSITDHFCQCGSCVEAFDAALRTYEKLREHQCSSWGTQITEALGVIAKLEKILHAIADLDKLVLDEVAEDEIMHKMMVLAVTEKAERFVGEVRKEMTAMAIRPEGLRKFIAMIERIAK